MNIFERAAEVLMKQGHCKGAIEDGTGAVCAFGALNVADTGLAHRHSGDASRAGDRAAQHLGVMRPAYEWKLSPVGNGTIVHPLAEWNDAPERTAEDVILLFKELAAEEGS